MSDHSQEARWEAELRALREELTLLRSEQLQLARSIDQLTATFRALAIHLGIAAEPYPKTRDEPHREVPGFG
jgi:hypothetical protein